MKHASIVFAAIVVGAAMGGISSPCPTQARRAATRPAPPGGVAAPTLPPTQPTTQPSTRPITQPTTQPAADAATEKEVAGLIEALGASDWRQRQDVVEKLVRMGEPARPALKELVLDTDNPDVRTAAQNVLSRIDYNRAYGPSFITLHLKDAEPKVAFAELGKQSFVEFKPYPDNLWETGSWDKVSLDVTREPYWAAMRKLTEKTGLGVQYMGNEGEIRLTRNAGNITGRSVVAGAFLIVATQITSNRTVAFGPGGANRVEQFTINLLAYPEPKLTILGVNGGMKVEEAVDDKGNSLLPRPADAARFGRMYGGSGNGGWSLYSPLSYPEHPGVKIARLRASAVFTLQTRSEKIEVDDLLSVKGVVRSAGGASVVVEECKKIGGNNYQLKISSTQGSAAFGEMYGNGMSNRLKVTDKKGNPLRPQGWGTSSSNTRMEMTITYVAGPNGRGEESGEPAKLTWEVPTETQEITVPFEFTDLEMP